MLALSENGREHPEDKRVTPQRGVVGIVLAAGRSSRFGSDKLLHPLRDGTPMGLASVLTLRAVIPRTVAVIGAHNAALSTLFAAHDIETTIAAAADSGMGSSIAAGIAAATEANGWVLALGDMPYIRPQTVAKVADALRDGGHLAAPSYQGQRGYPVGFSAAFLHELLALHGNEDIHAILQQHADDLLLLECEDPGILLDIDWQVVDITRRGLAHFRRLKPRE